MQTLAIQDWLLLAGVCALGAMTPGASLAMVLHHTLHGSARAGVRAGLAHALGIGVYAAATVAGLAVVLHRFPSLETGIRLAGSLFLLWLAWKSWRGAGATPADQESGGGRPARDGFLIAFLNPKVALFFLALFSQFIDAGMSTVARVQVAATAVVIDGAWYSLVALTLARGPILATLRRHHARVERATAIVLALIAVVVWV
ncbi:LysE family translocator [Alloalcanivorax gelatiniphagus]|uniref:LysE family translocator n=1 Tax=Alloalcanivorax gelatiniphagus TaxID=1194167 RepID=A0ABY2XIL0_9GAMM|nr:LysE family translocator [Alloalcanivorax gelatiniphagus]TMW11667.1 LysE family translocator [Alloalcanivorax gelatiniphagus]|tara:strand:- start:322 stop:927 length:606 start_codon:yes stop_codon:yes gene_type:complete